jgi:hypothetical protein
VAKPSNAAFWNDRIADHAIGTIPKITISRTAGPASAQPTA